MGSARGKITKSRARPRKATSRPRLVGRALVEKIQGALSLDLLHPNYRPGRNEEEWLWACRGHCYVAAEAAYHLFAKARGFEPWVFTHPNGSTHWWLRHATTGTIIDPTLPQLGGDAFDYDAGRRAAFLTRLPSRRARELMRRVTRAR